MAAPEAVLAPVAAPPLEGQADDATLVPVGPVGSQRRRKRGVLFWISLAWLGLILFFAIAASWLPLPDPTSGDVFKKLIRPLHGGHLLGTDGSGRDILSRIVHGSRVSVIISFASVGLGMTVGSFLGMAAGYLRGWWERIIMFFVDVQLAFPALILLLGLLAFVPKRSLLIITVVIGFLSIPIYVRVSRANTLAVSQREYVLAARALGAKQRRVIFREILPNVALPVMAFGLLAVSTVIVLEGTLSYLGLSVPQPTPTWGSMIAEGRRFLQEAPHLAAIPSVVMCLTVLSLTFVGDSLRGLFDVRESNI